MSTYVIRRLLLMIPTLLGITLVVFTVMAASPGGISAQSLIEGQNLEPQAKKALEDYYNQLYGLDSPPAVQYLRWLNNVSPVGFTFDEENNLSGFSFWKGSDLGTSFRYGRPVLDLLEERVPITLLLNALSLPLIYTLAIAVGVRAATERGKVFDVSSSALMLGLWSIPTMLAGVLLIGFFASDQYWHWFPTAGLSTREALDMPFLPHWGSLQEVALLFGTGAVGTILGIGLALKAPRLLRVGLLAGVGLSLGLWMGANLPDPHQGVTVLLSLLLIVAIGGLGYTDYTGLRVSLLGLLGAGLGLAVGAQWGSGEFVRGFLLDRLWHLVLPVLCLTYSGFAFLSKLTRTAVLENLMADYARTAQAKGLAENVVLWKHVFRNSLLPLITVSATLLPGLLAGSVIVESIFSIEGMGKLAVEAVQTRDRELVLSITLISGLLTLVGYLVADLCYAIADPRVSYD
ncbi:binding-protein-dependent transport systems inner membrane component [Nitrosococcus halophilus Nc 4]|uniref:Binding-protein-dependent transport systems inner membrane component n=1 Tax=Nitrosococcus halophilus (strain Nc4) TaxID=472759 RepID=D5C4U4_NITHN|nr:ABC transporter permease [Nitrosococcus halophilus]ADE13367.1 binding-protein-dependent transport systems inner membrane component [Nitrosococcus halophilus Nc 4]